MALTVEDGTGVAGANSYVTVAEARAYAADRGLTLPVADADVEKLLVKAADYIETEPQGTYKGYRTYPSVDTMKWPRTDVQIDDYALGIGEIPIQLKQAQCQLAVELQTVDPSMTLSGQLIKREKVDTLETEYAIDYRAGQKLPQLTKVDFLLKPLLRNTGILKVIRG
jgi:hypothetical protein